MPRSATMRNVVFYGEAPPPTCRLNEMGTLLKDDQFEVGQKLERIPLRTFGRHITLGIPGLMARPLSTERRRKKLAPHEKDLEERVEAFVARKCNAPDS